jgi:hypothetical protein
MFLFEKENAQTYFFLQKNNMFTFETQSFLLVHIQFTPSEEPKSFVN